MYPSAIAAKLHNDITALYQNAPESEQVKLNVINEHARLLTTLFYPGIENAYTQMTLKFSVYRRINKEYGCYRKKTILPLLEERYKKRMGGIVHNGKNTTASEKAARLFAESSIKISEWLLDEENKNSTLVTLVKKEFLKFIKDTKKEEVESKLALAKEYINTSIDSAISKQKIEDFVTAHITPEFITTLGEKILENAATRSPSFSIAYDYCKKSDIFCESNRTYLKEEIPTLHEEAKNRLPQFAEDNIPVIKDISTIPNLMYLVSHTLNEFCKESEKKKKEILYQFFKKTENIAILQENWLFAYLKDDAEKWVVNNEEISFQETFIGKAVNFFHQLEIHKLPRQLEKQGILSLKNSSASFSKENSENAKVFTTMGLELLCTAEEEYKKSKELYNDYLKKIEDAERVLEEDNNTDNIASYLDIQHPTGCFTYMWMNGGNKNSTPFFHYRFFRRLAHLNDNNISVKNYAEIAAGEEAIKSAQTISCLELDTYSDYTKFKTIIESLGNLSNNIKKNISNPNHDESAAESSIRRFYISFQEKIVEIKEKFENQQPLHFFFFQYAGEIQLTDIKLKENKILDPQKKECWKYLAHHEGSDENILLKLTKLIWERREVKPKINKIELDNINSLFENQKLITLYQTIIRPISEKREYLTECNAHSELMLVTETEKEVVDIIFKNLSSSDLSNNIHVENIVGDIHREVTICLEAKTKDPRGRYHSKLKEWFYGLISKIVCLFSSNPVQLSCFRSGMFYKPTYLFETLRNTCLTQTTQPPIS